MHYLSQQSAAQLTDRNYEKLVLGRGRDYDLFVLYTAREAQYGCGICGCVLAAPAPSRHAARMRAVWRAQRCRLSR